MLNICGIVEAILKMATGTKWPPQYRKDSTLSDIIKL
jgi:hypothetical protein